MDVQERRRQFVEDKDGAIVVTERSLYVSVSVFGNRVSCTCGTYKAQ